MRITLALYTIVVVALMAAVLSATAGATVMPPPSGFRGHFNKELCGPNAYERIKTKVTEFAVNDSAGTCVNATEYKTRFQVSKIVRDIGWQDPGMAAGFNPMGEPTCARVHIDTCFDFPVQVRSDGHPLASFNSWLAPGNYNQSFDIWFSPVKGNHSIKTRAGDTELMIWTAYPGIDDRSRFIAYANIDGKRFGIMSWEAHGLWRYVTYLWLDAPRVGNGRSLNVRGLYLNGFFANAESHGWLSSREWLWSIYLGWELNSGGLHNNYHDYSLTGLPYAPLDKLTVVRPADRTTAIGSTVRLQLKAHSSLGYRVSFSAKYLPKGLILRGSVISGRLEGNPVRYRVLITVRDRAGSLIRTRFAWVTRK